MSSEYQDQFHNKILIAIFMLFSVVYVEAELQRLEHPTKADGSFSFLVVGDWGRKGLYNQSAVARQMGIVGEMLDIDFVISTGDNFYKNGLTGVNDPAFDESFSNIYTAPSLQKQWYTVLGNHDYRGDVLAQLSHELTRRDGRWLCLRSYLLRSGFVEFFFVDTTPFLGEHFTNPEDHVYDWRGVLPRETYVKNLLKVIRVQDLDMALRHSTAKWKIVVAHHPIKSAGNPKIALDAAQNFINWNNKQRLLIYPKSQAHPQFCPQLTGILSPSFILNKNHFFISLSAKPPLFSSDNIA